MIRHHKFNKEKGDRFIRTHFLAEGCIKSTINLFKNDAKNSMPLGRKKGSGKKTGFNTQSTENDLSDL